MPFYSLELDWMHCGIWDNVHVCFMMQCLSLTLSNGWWGEEMTWSTDFESDKSFLWNWDLIKAISPWQMLYFMFTVNQLVDIFVCDWCLYIFRLLIFLWEKCSCNVCTEDLIWCIWSFVVASFVEWFAGFHIWSDESVTLTIISWGLQTSRCFPIASLVC